MTVEVQDPFNTYTAAPGATVFPYTFKIVSAADLIATIDDIVIDLGIDYSLSGVGSNDGGDLTLLVPLTGGQEVLLKRQMTFERETDYQQNGDFNAPVVNNDFDRLWLAMQQLGQDLKRSIKVAFTETTDQTIPVSPAARANKALVFDASGNITASNDDYNDQAADAAASAQAALDSQNAAASSASQTNTDRLAAEAAANAAAASAASINPTNLMHLTGNETAAGIKTFTDSPVVPDLLVDDGSSKAANAKLVKESISARIQINVRQAIQYGPVTGSPAVSDLIPQSQVGRTLAQGVILKCSTAPTLFSVANGFNADGSPNNLNWLTNADISVANLTASATNYIWVDTFAKTAGFVTVADGDQSGGTIPVTLNRYTFDYNAYKMYLGNGSAAAQSNRLIVAEVDTNGTVITAIRCAAYKAEYQSPVTALPAVATPQIFTHNVRSAPEMIDWACTAVCTSAIAGFSVGDRTQGLFSYNSIPASVEVRNFIDRKSCTIFGQSNSGFVVSNKSTSVMTVVGTANFATIQTVKRRY